MPIPMTNVDTPQAMVAESAAVSREWLSRILSRILSSRILSASCLTKAYSRPHTFPMNVFALELIFDDRDQHFSAKPNGRARERRT